MPNVTFYDRVEDAVQDVQLQTALNRTTTALRTNRDKAIGNLPESDALRDHARKIRAHTIANLDKYLGQFADSVARLGGNVFFAETAHEANQYVLQLAAERGVKTVVKSKSMVTEELELREELEERGTHVVETDLGEYIIQVADEKPSHIIAPVIHKTREQVADLFQNDLGATDEDIASVDKMTQFARRQMRKDFMSADMGITGCNFAVAETGSITLVMNEGNGRLTTTTPRIHVVVMGMERIVPTMEDLGVMVQLLARSATGQKLSVYTNIVTGPRREDEPDGADEYHVVILDNGRSNLLGGELAEILYCIRCGACLNACPVYQNIGGHAYGSVYPGPVGAVVTPGLYGVDPWNELPHASTLCGACEEVCPVRIDIPRMLLELRRQSAENGNNPYWIKAGLSAYKTAAKRPALFNAGGKASQLASNLLAKDGWITSLPGPLANWTKQRDFPAFAKKSFKQRWREERGS
ncbi:MAG: LutB/LldF family L-lactate oxidation iron-sulfur protein [Candidatus Promineifilaceae bacterium]